MRAVRKWISTFLAVLFAVTLLGGVAIAQAEGTDTLCYELSSTLDGDEMYVSVVAVEDITTCGFSGAITYDRDALTLTTGKAASGLSLVLNAQGGRVVMDSVSDVDVAAGQALVTLTFRVNDAFNQEKNYDFAMEILEAYSDDLEDYPWVPATINTTWQGQTGAPAPQPGGSETDPGQSGSSENPGTSGHTVTFEDEKGNPIATITVPEGEGVLPPDVTAPEGYRLAGWTVNGQPFDETQPITDDMVLIPVWEEDDSAGEPQDGPAALTMELLPSDDLTEGTFSFLLRMGDEEETFQLQMGEKREFTIPAGVEFELVEEAVEGYAINAKVIVGDKTSELHGKVGEKLTVTGSAAQGDTSVELTHTAKAVKSLSSLLWLLLIPVLALAAGIYAGMRKKQGGKRETK